MKTGQYWINTQFIGSFTSFSTNSRETDVVWKGELGWDPSRSACYLKSQRVRTNGVDLSSTKKIFDQISDVMRYQFVAKWLKHHWLWLTLVNNKLVRNSYEIGLGEALPFGAKPHASPFRMRRCFQMRSHRIASMWFADAFSALVSSVAIGLLSQD